MIQLRLRRGVHFKSQQNTPRDVTTHVANLKKKKIKIAAQDMTYFS